MRLYIMRHGETLWNTEGRLQGKADVALNENGIRLAKECGEKMKEVSFDLVISSPLLRARQTAEAVLGEQKVPVIEDERIEEISFGGWEGLCCKGSNYEIPSEEFPKFFTDPFSYIPPADGESIPDIIERTKEFYDELIANPEYQDKTILITVHGCSSRAILYQVMEDKTDFWRGKVPPNCSVSIIEVKDGKSTILEMDKIYYDPKEVKDFYGTSERVKK